jgi:hypothetical protein
MDRKVFLSLLSMDSYNRAYGRRVRFDTRADGAIRIGDAFVLQTSEDTIRSWITADFFAADYIIGTTSRVAGFANGNRIISYRGTDLLGEDVFNYSIGVESPQSPVGRGSKSASKIARHSPSTTPSSTSGRNRLWNARTAAGPSVMS